MLVRLLRRLLGGRGGIPLAGLVPTDAGMTALAFIPDFCGGMFCAISLSDASFNTTQEPQPKSDADQPSLVTFNEYFQPARPIDQTVDTVGKHHQQTELHDALTSAAVATDASQNLPRDTKHFGCHMHAVPGPGLRNVVQWCNT